MVVAVAVVVVRTVARAVTVMGGSGSGSIVRLVLILAGALFYGTVTFRKFTSV